MGRLIPAGTGLSMYRKLGVKVEEETKLVQESEQINEKILDRPPVN
jgi:hypothetical protein